MDLELSKVLTEAYLVLSDIFHSAVVMLLAFWVSSRCIDNQPTGALGYVDKIYRSRSTIQIVRISKIFRLSALIPIFLLILIFSGSRLLSGVLKYLGGFTDFFLRTSYDRSLQHLRLGDENQLGRLLKSACGDVCETDVGQLTSLSYGDFISHFQTLRNEVAATSPELLERTFSSLTAPWEITLSGYLVATKVLLLLVAATLLFREWIERTTFISLSSTKTRRRTIYILLLILVFVRLEWEQEIETTVMRDFNTVVSSSAPRLTIVELRNLDTSDRSLIEWREDQLRFVESGIWLRYHYNQVKRLFCLSTIGLVALPEWGESLSGQMCRVKYQIATFGRPR
ncbi:hypothetical protein SAMN04488245_1151 [Alloyangia pacifica]|uniref:Uncharacterized protein n=1 Tax=Alloyangia pacifica TaxID=311180 RepID=A0A1I6W0Z4_9RHOB|nr:hypothetical protein SAMN04488245_1151 [Alloyangia pacifica]SFT19677.1 hypothetical protein SAMN04488050_1142 [Alloyangia pacifica]